MIVKPFLNQPFCHIPQFLGHTDIQRWKNKIKQDGFTHLSIQLLLLNFAVKCYLIALISNLCKKTVLGPVQYSQSDMSPTQVATNRDNWTALITPKNNAVEAKCGSPDTFRNDILLGQTQGIWRRKWSIRDQCQSFHHMSQVLSSPTVCLNENFEKSSLRTE